MTKEVIMEQITEHQTEIDSLKNDLKHIHSESARNAINKELSFLEDNQYRYKMQLMAYN